MNSMLGFSGETAVDASEALGAGVSGVLGTTTRGLNDAERANAERVFGDSLNLDEIVLQFYDDQVPLPRMFNQRPPGSLPYVSGNVINIQRSVLDDENDIQSTGARWQRQNLMHELTHVWQYQNSGGDWSYAVLSLTDQVFGDAYSGWRGPAEARVPWEAWSVENQGQAVEAWSVADYWRTEWLERPIETEARQADYTEQTQTTNGEPLSAEVLNTATPVQPLDEAEEVLALLEPYVEALRSGQGAPSISSMLL